MMELRAMLENWLHNLKISRNSPIAGDYLSGPALDFVIEQIEGILKRNP